MARELILLPRFKRDYRSARKHPEFDPETLEYVFDVMISGGRLPDAFREHRLGKRGTNWTGLTECHLGADLLLIYQVRIRPSSFIASGLMTGCFLDLRVAAQTSGAAAVKRHKLLPTVPRKQIAFPTCQLSNSSRPQRRRP